MSSSSVKPRVPMNPVRAWLRSIRAFVQIVVPVNHAADGIPLQIEVIERVLHPLQGALHTGRRLRGGDRPGRWIESDDIGERPAHVDAEYPTGRHRSISSPRGDRGCQRVSGGGMTPAARRESPRTPAPARHAASPSPERPRRPCPGSITTPYSSRALGCETKPSRTSRWTSSTGRSSGLPYPPPLVPSITTTSPSLNRDALDLHRPPARCCSTSPPLRWIVQEAVAPGLPPNNPDGFVEARSPFRARTRPRAPPG